MTDPLRDGHSGSMTAAALDLGFDLVRPPRAAEPRARTRSDVAPAPLTFERVYDRWFDFVWRSVRRLGVPDGSVDDAVQDVFLVVHRRLGDFEGRSSIKTWLFGIAMRVAKDHRRAAARRRPAEPLRESMVDAPRGCPHEHAAKNEAVRLLHALLDALDDEKRAVFVMAELEQMSVPEIAETLDANLNTVYSRLRAARAAFDGAVERHRARDRRAAG